MHKANAETVRQAGAAAAERQRKNDAYALNSFGARAGMAGVVAHEGSALLAELDFAERSELEARHVQQGYEVQRAERQTAGNFAKWQASRINPGMEAGMSVLKSVGSAASSGAFGGLGGGPPTTPTAGAQTGGGLATSFSTSNWNYM